MKILDKTTQTYKELVLKPGGDTLPIGSIVAFSGENIPNGWLLCDGSVVSRTTYSELFNAIGLNYVEDGVEWLDEERFPLPNAKGRTLVGKDSTDTDFNTLGKTSGEKTHTLTVDEMPSHNHLRDIENKIVNNGSGGAWSPSLKGTGNMTDENNSTRNTGGGQAHNNLQPSLTLNYIIKAKNTVVVKGDVIQENGTASTTNVYSAKTIDNKLKTSIVTGQEVATNEYINGKRVYKRNISVIAENSSGTTLTLSNINFNFSEIWIDESNSFISNENETLSINWYFAAEDYCRVWIGKNTKIIRYRTGGNLSGRTFNVMLKYTKNT